MSTEESAERSPGPIWNRPEPGARRAGHTREEIARAAIAVADAEGFEAVSMRRIATELGAGTMTLYHYVRTKDELLALMDDAVMAELVIPADELPAGWREGMAAIAHRNRNLFRRHPWVLEAFRGEDVGPNVLHHIEQSLDVASRTGIGDRRTQIELMGLVDDYVYGHVVRTAHDQYMKDPEAGERAIESMADYIDAQLQTGAFPHLADMAGDDTRAALREIAHMQDDEARFERGLKRLLDGIALEIDPRAAIAEARRRPSRSAGSTGRGGSSGRGAGGSRRSR
jgi:AcrR family transcriptional regulator